MCSSSFVCARMGLDMIRLILAFAFSYFSFLTAPVVLRSRVAPGPSPTAGDMVDLLTPFVLVGLYALLYRAMDDETRPKRPVRLAWSEILFVFFAILFVEGHGMHLSANSIGRFLAESPGSDAFAIAYFYDEVLGHYLWRAGTLGLTGVLLGRHWRRGETEPRWGPLAVASMVYGLTYAVASTESQTVPMDLPASVAIAGLFGARWWGVRAMPGGPVFAFYGLAHGVVLLFLATWGLYFGGFPEPSQLLAGRG